MKLKLQGVNDINCQNYTVDISRPTEQESLIILFSISDFSIVSKSGMCFRIDSSLLLAYSLNPLPLFNATVVVLK